MVAVRTVKLRNIWYYKKSSNTLRNRHTQQGILDAVNSKWYNKEWLRT